jgi:hypothetical protein
LQISTFTPTLSTPEKLNGAFTVRPPTLVSVPMPDISARPEDTWELVWLTVTLLSVPASVPPTKVTPVRDAFAYTQLLISVSEIGALAAIVKPVVPEKLPVPTPVADTELAHGEPPPRHSVRFVLLLLERPIVPEPLNVKLMGLADAESAARHKTAATPRNFDITFLICPPKPNLVCASQESGGLQLDRSRQLLVEPTVRVQDKELGKYRN